jgi:hypothetical protein
MGPLMNDSRVSVEILARKLSDADGDTVVQPSLLNPPGIEAGRVRAYKAARPGQEPQVQSEIAAALREAGRVEVSPGGVGGSVRALEGENSYAMSPDDGYCAQRYRSYDPASGTYMGYDGRRHSCE